MSKPTLTPSSELPSSYKQLARRWPLRILVAEDNQVNQKVILLLLGKLGYTADVANDGKQVLQALAQPYETILMDIQMPELDGLEATRQIRRDWPSERQPWIIAVTASTIEGTREKCFAAGMNDYLSKPLHIDALAGALERGAYNRQQRAESGPGPSHPSGIDPVQMASLRELTSGGEQLRELVEIFVDNSHRVFDEIRRAVERQDLDTLIRQAHSLKGSSGALGGARLAQLCTQLEDDAETASVVEPLLSEIEAELAQVHADLRAELAKDRSAR